MDKLNGKTLTMEIFLNSSGEYEYNVILDDNSFIENPMDGGCCTGSFKNAIQMMLDTANEMINIENEPIVNENEGITYGEHYESLK
jgi:hypothetical protein